VDSEAPPPPGLFRNAVPKPELAWSPSRSRKLLPRLPTAVPAAIPEVITVGIGTGVGEGDGEGVGVGLGLGLGD
jgi:hypothetical protein